MTRPPHILLVEAPYYTHIAELLRRGAERALAAAGATYEIISVPGAFEIPAAIGMVARASDRFDGFVALGCVIRGETTHYDHICAECARGLQDLAVRQGLAELVPWLAERVGRLHDWSQVAVLNVESSRVDRWYKPGLLLIGDAAHVMSPVAGVGINVAVQDAVAAANLLTEPLGRGAVTEQDLAAVQRQREPAVRAVQGMQRLIQERIAAPGLDAAHEFRPPWWARQSRPPPENWQPPG